MVPRIPLYQFECEVPEEAMRIVGKNWNIYVGGISSSVATISFVLLCSAKFRKFIHKIINIIVV